MTLRRCNKCGLPRLLSRDLSWPGNGVIVSRGDPGNRFVFIEADFLSTLWSELEGFLDLPVSDAVLNCEYLVVRSYIEELMFKGWRGQVLRHVPRPVFSRFFDKQRLLFGYGMTDTMKYRRGRILVVRATHIHDIFSMVGGLRGLFEILEGKSSKAGWRKEENSYVITLVFAPRESERQEREQGRSTAAEVADRQEQIEDFLPPGPKGLERCPSCGLPNDLRDLRWMGWEGTIVHRHRENRYVLFSVYILRRIIEELEMRARQDLGPIILDISKNFIRQRLRHMPIGDKDGLYRDFFRDISINGLGDIVDVTRGESHLEMTIHNPFYPPVLAGTIAGMFEHVEGELTDVDYSIADSQILELRVRTT